MPERSAVHAALNMLSICAWVAVGALLAYLSTLLHTHSQYLAFLPSVILCSRFYSVIGAVTSQLLSTLALWNWFVPPEGFAIPNLEDGGHLLGFVLVASFLSWMIRQERRSNAQLTRENCELGYRVSFLLRALHGLGGTR